MKDFRLESCWRAWLIMLASLLATGYLSYSAKTDAEALAQQYFAAETDEITLKILTMLEAHKQVLLGGAALFNASHHVNRNEWKQYVSRLSLDDHFKGIQGLGFAEWIPHNRLEQHVNTIRQQGFPEYRVRPADKRESYSSIIYLEPFEGRNLRAFGFDMYSEPLRRAAMERARDENMAALSGKVTLLQETDRDVQAGTLMYVPVYRHSAPIDTVEQRRAALYGWVYSPFRMSDFFRELLKQGDHGNLSDMHIQIFEGAEATADKQLFNSKPLEPHLMLPLMLERHLSFGGQEWTLLYEKYGQNVFDTDYSKAWWILLAGTLSSILLFFLFAAYMGMRKALQAADNAASELRRSEENLRVLAKNESVLIWMSGPDRKCNYFNQVWLDFTGRTLAQETGDGWTKGVHPNDLANCLATYNSAFDVRRAFTLEYRLRHFSGNYRWIVDHGVPRHNEHGKFIGYIGSCIDITERKHVEQKLQLTQFAMDNAFVGIYWLDKHARIRYINKQVCTTLDYAHDELLNLSIHDLDPLFPLELWSEHWESLKHDKTQFYETLHKRKDGTRIPVEISTNYVKFGEDEFNVAFCRDISERKCTEQRLELTQFAMDNAFVEIYWLDKNANIRYVNKRVCSTLGYTREELLQLSIPDLDPLFPVAQWNQHWKELKREKSQFFETQHRRKDGTIIPVEVSANYVKFGEQEYNVVFCRDISERKRTEEEIHTLAYFDTLTKLPNRRMLSDRLTQAVAASRRSGQFGALLFLDLDNFKPLNDTCGHAIGDLLLIQVAERISSCVREVDTVARFGGDEFVVIMGDLSEDRNKLKAQAGIVSEKIRTALAEPYVLKLYPGDASSNATVEHHCTSSIGVTLFDGREDDPESILKHGDIAMYHAKAAGRNNIRFYE